MGKPNSAKQNFHDRVAENLNKQFDGITGGVIVIDQLHHHIHEGECYTLSLASSTLATAAYMGYLLTTPASSKGYVHLEEAEISSGGVGAMTFTEVSTVAVGGAAAVVPVNRERNSTNTSAVSAFTNTGTLTGGTTLEVAAWGTAGFVGSIGGGGSSSLEWVLKPSTSYDIRIYNGSGAKASAEIILTWYEED